MRRLLLWSVSILVLLAPATAAAQSGTDHEPRITFSGLIQPQYELRSLDPGTNDRALVRRLMAWFEATLPSDWRAKFQVDAGPAVSGGDEHVIVRDAYLRYSGWDDHGLLLTLGNQKVPFSRSALGSALRRGLIERPITGERGTGSPGRAPAIGMEGWHRRRTLYWSGAVASALQAPDANEIRIDGIANADEGWNRGTFAGARVELHPLGEVPSAQGDFLGSAMRVTVGAGAYGWWRNAGAEGHGAGLVDANRVSGVEVSGALRGHGFSVDAEYDHVVSHAADELVTVGLYRRGRAAIDKASVEAGYMLTPRRLEALLGVESADAPAFDAPWRRISPGVNWYVRGHNLKFSAMHRESFNDRGTRNARSRTTYLQAQFAF